MGRPTEDPQETILAAEEELAWRKRQLIRAFFVASDEFDPKTDPTYKAVSGKAAELERKGQPLADQVLELQEFIRSLGLEARGDRSVCDAARGMAGYSQPDHWIHQYLEREVPTHVLPRGGTYGPA